MSPSRASFRDVLVAWFRERRAEAGWTVGLAIATLVAMTFPERFGGDVIVGSPLGETDNHLWMFWREGQRFFAGASVLGNAPKGVPVVLMDPINLPVYLLGHVLSPAFGWWLLQQFNLALMMAGAYGLARRFTNVAGARVAMVACGSAPFVAGVVDFGISESWTLGWMLVHVAALVSAARDGGATWTVLAGLSLGAVGLSGWYHAFYGLVVEALLVPVLLWRHRRVGLLAQGGIALVMVLPSFLGLLDGKGTWEARWRLPAPGPPGPRTDWGELPVFGVDVLTFVVPHPTPVNPSKATYLGLVLLLLVCVGLWRRHKAVWAMFALSVPFLLLATGYWPTVGGNAVGWSGPAKWLVDLAPSLRGMSHWYRAAGPAAMFLGVAAGIAVGEYLPRARRWTLAVCVLIFADAWIGGPTAWPRQAYRPDAPAALMALPGTGGLIQLPFDNGRKEFVDTPPRTYTRWQLAHGRPISENYEGVDDLLDSSALIAPVDEACLVPDTLPPYYQPRPEMRGIPTPSAKRGAPLAADLAAQGFDWVVLHRARCPVQVTPIRALDTVLGPGIELQGGVRVWPLRQDLDLTVLAPLRADADR